ncbi:MAG TPA: hypothetical protein VHH36_00440 [Candidatus Thermoplasmatota archaeon]|nr:hypothetical protein [Candidatus Thermoplasmatota archaeon]
MAKRRAQRGSYTLGDGCDEDFLAALRALRAHDAATAGRIDATGETLGRHVFARRMFEDSYRGAMITLSASLAASGFGTLEIDDLFHRTAHVRFAPRDGLAGAETSAVDALMAGVLRGFMAEAFNCEATARALAPHTFELRLGEGRDVNRRARA